MFKQIRKFPKYSLKLAKQGNFLEMFHIVRNVMRKHWLIAMAARLDRKAAFVQFKGSLSNHEINQFIELVPFRRKKVFQDIYLWEFGKKAICCNYVQLLGLKDEYLADLFDKIYHYDWLGKKVVDIGGFVGDTALYFLSKGAEKIIIYEPVSKNMEALMLNLKGFDDRIESFQ
jgi:hypothetical protein